MPTVLADLRVYKAQLDDAIAALDRLAVQRGETQRGGRRGRPPKEPAAGAVAVAGKGRKRKSAKSTV